MLEDGLNYFKKMSEQPEKLFQILYSHKQTIDEVLPFYIALLAKTSSDPDKFLKYTMDSLEKIYGSDNTGKTLKEREITTHAYRVSAGVSEIFNQLDDY